jgi:hypothetical protein
VEKRKIMVKALRTKIGKIARGTEAAILSPAIYLIFCNLVLTLE